MDRLTACQPAWRAGQTAGHVESYFLKCNDVARQLAVWLKFTLFVPADQPHKALAEVWAVWFDGSNADSPRAWKQSFPLADCHIAAQPLLLLFGDNRLAAQHSSGSLPGPAGTIRWDLRWDEGEAPLAHFPHAWMYRAPLPKSKLTAPFPSSACSGWVEIDGRRIEFARAPGTLGHNWGREHAWHYAWGHCNAFDGHGPASWFEGVSSRLRIGRWITPYLNFGHLSLDGKRYAFNRIRHLTSGTAAADTTQWRFRLEASEFALQGEFAAPPQRFICLHYHNPDGQLGYCLNSKLAEASLQLLDRHGRPIVKLESRAAALEILLRNSDHGIRFGA